MTATHDPPMGQYRSPFQHWLYELRRRHVFRVLGGYVVSFWVLLQVGDVVFPALGAPSWAMMVLIAAGLAGLPLAAVASWVWDLTPAGIQRTDDLVDTHVGSELHLGPRWIDYVIIVALLVILAIVLLTPDRRTPFPVGQSVAVLPFHDLSPDQDSRYFADGVAESVMDRLSRIPGIVVSARTSSFSFRDRDLDAREVATALGVDTLLEGSVQKAGQRLRVTARLIDGATGRQIWGDRYDAPVGEVFEIQDRISQAISSTMRVQIASGEDTGLETASPRAYDEYLRGRSLLRQRENLEQIEQAQAHFEASLDADPDFALASTGRCSALWERYERVRERALAETAIEYCRVVEEQHGRLAETQVALGNLRLGTGRPELARQAFEEALRREPHNANAHAGLAAAYRDLGDLAASETQIREAIDLDPAYWYYRWFLGVVHLLSGRHEDTVAALGDAIRLNPNVPDPFITLGSARFLKGDFLPAADAFEKAIQLAPDPVAYSNAGTTYFFAGEFSRAEAMFRRAVEMNPSDSRFTGFLAWAIRLQPGRIAEAEPWHRETISTTTARLAVNENDTDARATLAAHLAALGLRAAAEGALASLPKRDELGVNALMLTGFAHFYLGDETRSALAFERALALGLPPFMLHRDPRLAEAWARPAFARLRADAATISTPPPQEGKSP